MQANSRINGVLQYKKPITDEKKFEWRKPTYKVLGAETLKFKGFQPYRLAGLRTYKVLGAETLKFKGFKPYRLAGLPISSTKL